MAQLPLPGRGGRSLTGERQLSDLAALRPGAELVLGDLPLDVRRVLETLSAHGHEAVVVGGSLRDALVERRPLDWDVATSAVPATVAALFPGSSWENRFGTVTVTGDTRVEVTTYRSESGYSDRRRPDAVSWGRSLDDDLARRDFTINAIAWLPLDLGSRSGRLVDRHGGLRDLRDRILRTVGVPHERFAEDALRLLRAARLASRLDLTIDPPTEAAIVDLAPTVATVSGERVRDELLRILRADAPPWHDAPPSGALRLMERLGLLGVLLPELSALRGVPQAKATPGDALDHTLATVDAAPDDPPELRLAALLHDLGKAPTLAEGHFHGHELVGAELADQLLARLRAPARQRETVVQVVREHMFGYDSRWTDAAVRRFVRRVGPERVRLLLALRRADDAASGAPEPSVGGVAELEQRIAAVAEAAPLLRRDLAVDGFDLQRELDLPPGPAVGRLLAQLTDAVVEDPALNRREDLLALARRRLNER